jgi:DNA polymerase-1
MATSRGITDTKTYDRDDVIERYGIAPEQIPDFWGLKGDTSDNIPGVPGIGDKTASDLLQKFGSLEAVLDSVDQISGAKRKQNLTEHAEAARISKRLATAQRDVPVDLDLRAELAKAPDRSQLRDTFRRFELREPLRRLEEALGEQDAAPLPASEQQVVAELREATLADLAGLPAEEEVAVALRPPETPEGELLPVDTTSRFAAATDGAVLTGPCEDPAEVVEALVDHALVAHDAKALGTVPATLGHDTLLGAYLLEPARRAFPLRELTEERGLATDVGDPAAADAVLLRELAAWQRERIDERGLRPVPRRDRAAARRRPALDGALGGQAQRAAPRRGRRARAHGGRASSSARSGSSPAPSSSSARPSSSARCCSSSSA